MNEMCLQYEYVSRRIIRLASRVDSSPGSLRAIRLLSRIVRDQNHPLFRGPNDDYGNIQEEPIIGWLSSIDGHPGQAGGVVYQKVVATTRGGPELPLITFVVKTT
jgi:hypothetical protein